jgi:hypothetical protein
MGRKKTCLTREKRASLFVKNEKLNMQGKNPAFGIFPKATIYAKTAFYYDEWKLWYSALAYPMIFLILLMNLKFVRVLPRHQ